MCRVGDFRVIALSCGIKISAVHCLVLSQSMRVTDGRTDGQNYDSTREQLDTRSINGSRESLSCAQLALYIINVYRGIVHGFLFLVL